MKKIFGVLILVLMIFVLGACNNNNSIANSNTITAADLSEMESAILATTSDQSFVFDFNVNTKRCRYGLKNIKMES